MTSQTLVLQWKPEYELGDPLIDAQHKRIFTMANTSLGCTASADIVAAIMELYKYTRMHFDAEEGLMAARGYDAIACAAHADMHNKITAKLVRFSSAIGGSPLEEVSTGLHALITDWVLNHILTEDMNLPR